MGRRGKGEGTIRKRDDGRWEARLFVGYADGKQRFRYFYARTRREVQEELVRAQHELQQGIVVEPCRWSVEQYLSHWLDNVVKPKVKPRTWIGYEQYARLYLIPHLGRVRLTSLTPQHVQAMHAKLLERVSPRTVHHLHAILKTALNQAVKGNLVARNVASLVDGPRVGRFEVTALTGDQVRALLEAAKEDRFECLYVLAVCSGLREGELFALRWADIELERARVRVRSTLSWRKGPWELTEPKSRTSRRAIVLPPQAVQALRDHRRRQLEQRLAAEHWQENDLVFSTRVGSPLSGGNVQQRSFKPLLKKAGLPDIRFHDLRPPCLLSRCVRGPRERGPVASHSAGRLAGLRPALQPPRSLQLVRRHYAAALLRSVASTAIEGEGMLLAHGRPSRC